MFMWTLCVRASYSFRSVANNWLCFLSQFIHFLWNFQFFVIMFILHMECYGEFVLPPFCVTRIYYCNYLFSKSSANNFLNCPLKNFVLSSLKNILQTRNVNTQLLLSLLPKSLFLTDRSLIISFFGIISIR